MEPQPTQVFRTSTADELPPELERRLVLRLLGYWRSLLNERPFPSFADLDPAQIPDLWPHCFVLELAGADGRPVFRAVGAALARHAKRPLVGRPVSDMAAEEPADSLPGAATAYVATVLQKRAPVSRGGTLRETDGTERPYRSILLPMSDDGETINGLFGAASCQEAPQD